MAVTLDTIDLSDLILENEIGVVTIQSEAETSLGGTPIVWEQALIGASIDLISPNTNSGWVSRTDLLAIKALANVPNTTYTLVYESDTITVRFRNEDPPVVEHSPIIERPNQDGTDWHTNVRIKLMKVED